MCTLAVAFDPSAPVPLVVAANRDEALARPATPPRVWPGTPPVLAPRDEQAGGTWLGLNAHGLFVGVTNRFAASPVPGRTSRGHLVRSALAHPDARTLHAALAPTPADAHPPHADPAHADPAHAYPAHAYPAHAYPAHAYPAHAYPAHAYNAFHLLYADRHSAHVTWSDGERLHQQELAPGVHVLSERSFRAEPSARDAWVREAFTRALGEGPEGLMRLLATHAPDGALPMDRPCVHLPALGYGTRSSLVLSLGRDWSGTRLWWAEGAPCTAGFVDVSALLQELACRAA